MTHLTPEEQKELRSKLEEEKGIVTKELLRIGRKNPINAADWEARPEELDIQESDRNEAADRIEAFEENTAILKELETRFNNIERALKKMDAGTYGICEVGGQPIPKERLFANPAAITCTKHADDI
ncbi:MAG TPA: TraR/DksA C4-type zinc finger protein [Candidatus Paceibacterota bacterium]